MVRRGTAVLLCGLLAFAAVTLATEEVAALEAEGMVEGPAKTAEPPVARDDIKPNEEDELEKVGSFKDMKRVIYKKEKAMMNSELSKDDGGEEEIAIGNTLKTMEAKHAVEEELETEIAINCEVGEWGPYGKCSVACDGGKQKRSRTVERQPQNNGAACPELDESIECNTESCASEAYQRRATRRKLTAAEKKRESLVNRRKIAHAMRANSVYEMKQRTREVMKKLVHTDLADVKLPGEIGERSPEAQVRKSLQDAMAKNAVSDALKTYEASKVAAADQVSQSSEDDKQFKSVTQKPIGR